MHCRVRCRLGHRLTAFVQPLLHELDFVRLGTVDASGDVAQLGQVGPIADQCRHLYGLVVVRNHVLHELHVIRRIAVLGDLDRLVGAELPARVTWGPGQNDRHILRRGGPTDERKNSGHDERRLRWQQREQFHDGIPSGNSLL